MASQKILTPNEAAQELKVSLKTIYRWIYDGKLNASQVGMKTYRIFESELVSFMNRTKVKPHR